MGLFGKVFSKEACIACGKEAGSLSRKRLRDDSVVCKDCARGLSPFIDRHQGLFCVASGMGGKRVESGAQLVDANPDLIGLDAIRSVEIEGAGHSGREVKRTENGEQVSYDPRRYEYPCNVRLHLALDHPYVKAVSADMTSGTVYIQTEGERARRCWRAAPTRRGRNDSWAMCARWPRRCSRASTTPAPVGPNPTRSSTWLTSRRARRSPLTTQLGHRQWRDQLQRLPPCRCVGHGGSQTANYYNRDVVYRNVFHALNQVEDDDLVLPATGHDWGEWQVVQAPTSDSPGVERRVCRNDPSHMEERAVDPSTAVFTITYDLNGGILDEKTGTVKVSVTAGQTIMLPKPERSGYEFDYWEGSRYNAGDQYR